MAPSCTARNLRHGCGSPGSSSASPGWPVSRRRAARSPCAGAARSAEYDPEELRERLRSRLAEADGDGRRGAAGRRDARRLRRPGGAAPRVAETPEGRSALSGSRGTRGGGWPPRSAASRASGPRPRARRRCAARSARRAGRRPAAPGGARRAGTRSGRSGSTRRAAVAVTAPGATSRNRSVTGRQRFAQRMRAPGQPHAAQHRRRRRRAAARGRRRRGLGLRDRRRSGRDDLGLRRGDAGAAAPPAAASAPSALSRPPLTVASATAGGPVRAVDERRLDGRGVRAGPRGGDERRDAGRRTAPTSTCRPATRSPAAAWTGSRWGRSRRSARPARAGPRSPARSWRSRARPSCGSLAPTHSTFASGRTQGYSRTISTSSPTPSKPPFPAATTNSVPGWLRMARRSAEEIVFEPSDALTIRTPAPPARSKAAATSELQPRPRASSTRSGMIAASGATPATPASSRLAARMPAMCVPWPLASSGAASRSTKSQPGTSRPARSGWSRSAPVSTSAIVTPAPRVTAHAAAASRSASATAGDPSTDAPVFSSPHWREKSGSAASRRGWSASAQATPGSSRSAARASARSPVRRAHELHAGQRERADEADAGVGPQLRAGVARHLRPDHDVALAGDGRRSAAERDRDAESGGAAEAHAGTESRHQSSTQRLRRPSSCQSTGKNASSSSSSPGRR